VNTKLQWSHGRLNSATNFTKPKKKNKYFWGFRILKQEQKETTNKAKYIWIFQISNRKWRTKQTKARKPKRQTKRNNGNIFVLFVFWKVEIRTRITEKKEAKRGYTKYRQNMICR
jgi:hypothetical protein